MNTNHIPANVVAAAGLAALAGPALGQTNIDPAHKYAWQENCGWTNWRDANGGAQGVVIRATYLEGFIWGENIGWINVGDGTPGGGSSYTNASGSDAGVNILAGGNLSGFGWGENVGWINFNTAAALGAQRARFDSAAGRLRGYAWGENIGWLNLDNAGAYIAVLPSCYANCDGSTGTPKLTGNDFLCFINAFAGGQSYANCDGSTGTPSLTGNDFLCFINAYAAGCS